MKVLALIPLFLLLLGACTPDDKDDDNPPDSTGTDQQQGTPQGGVVAGVDPAAQKAIQEAQKKVSVQSVSVVSLKPVCPGAEETVSCGSNSQPSCFGVLGVKAQGLKFAQIIDQTIVGCLNSNNKRSFSNTPSCKSSNVPPVCSFSQPVEVSQEYEPTCNKQGKEDFKMYCPYGGWAVCVKEGSQHKPFCVSANAHLLSSSYADNLHYSIRCAPSAKEALSKGLVSYEPSCAKTSDPKMEEPESLF